MLWCSAMVLLIHADGNSFSFMGVSLHATEIFQISQIKQIFIGGTCADVAGIKRDLCDFLPIGNSFSMLKGLVRRG